MKIPVISKTLPFGLFIDEYELFTSPKKEF